MRNVSEKCNREMIRGQINARDEPTCHAEVACTWQSSDPMESTPAASPAVFAIPKVVKPPPNIHHAGVEAVDGPRS